MTTQPLDPAPSPPAVLPVPGLHGAPLLGVLPKLLRRPFPFLMDTASRYDGLVRLGIGPFSAYLVSHPEYVRRILVDNHANYEKGRMMEGIRVALGNGLFTADGDRWKRQRRLMAPVFHRPTILKMVDRMAAAADEHMHTWQARIDRGEPVDVLQELTLFNIDLILQTLFGATIDAADARNVLEATQGVFLGMSKRVWAFFVPRGVPVPGQGAYRRAIARLDEVINRLVDTRRASGVQHDDLLGMLLAARDEETGQGMTTAQLRDEIFTMFLAGYESTATGLSWALYLLSQHPDVDRRLRDEVDAVLGARVPTLDDIPALSYTRMVIDETLRLYPSFPMYFRTSIGADALGPYRIPGGAPIIVSPYATHHDSRYWHEPDRFDPERFAPGQQDPGVRRAYYPFGQGERKCIGRDFSLVEATVCLAMLVQRYDRALAPGTTIELHYAMSLNSRHGVPLILHRRAIPQH